MLKSAIKKYTSFLIKFLTWIIAIVVALAILIIILIQLPLVQEFAKNQTVSWLNEKLKSKVSIAKLRIDFPNHILLEKIYFEDQQKDSLLWCNRLSVDISLFKLLQNKVQVKAVELEGIGMNIKRNKPDTVFNYNFIIQAFASKTNTEKSKSDSSTSLQFNLGKIDIKNCSFRFKDDVAGINTNLFLGSLQTAIKEFNLEKSIFNFSDLNIATLNLQLEKFYPLVTPHSDKTKEKKPPSNSLLPEISLSKIALVHVSLNYKDAIAGIHTELNADQLLLLMGKMDLNKLIFPIDQLTISKSNLAFAIDKIGKTNSAAQELASKPKDSSTTNWLVTAKNILIDSNNISFDNYNAAPIKKGIDFQHLQLRNLHLQLDSLDANPLTYRGRLQKLSVKEKSGLQLLEFSTHFYYSDQQAKLEHLLLKTDRSVLQEKLILKYPSVGSIITHPENIQINANLRNSKLAISDILLLAPTLDKTLHGYQRSVISINTEMNGYLSNLKIPRLELSGIGNSSIKANGIVRGLPKVDHLYADLNIAQLISGRKDIEGVAPPKTLPVFLRIPDLVSMNGKFKGTIKAFSTQINAHSSDGDAKIEATMSDQKSFSGTVQLDSLNLGKILSQEKNLGNISLKATATGKGFDYKTMEAEMHANILDANVRDYRYNNLFFGLNLNNGNAAIESSLNDPNLSYILNASAELNNPFPSFKINFKVDTINLTQLHLAKDQLAFHGRVYGDFQNSNPDSLDGNLMVRNMHLTYQKKTFSTDSIILTAKNEIDYQSLDLNSKPVKMHLLGKYKLTELGTALEHTINQYYQIPGFKDTSFLQQDWNADFRFNTSPLVLRFMPELEGTDTIRASMHFNSALNDLKLNATAALVQYNNYHIKKLIFEAATGKDQLDYHLRLHQAGNPSFIINETSLDGFVKQKSVFGNLIFRDKKFEKNYQLAVILNQLSNGFKVHFNPDSLLLNKQKWLVKEGNYIRYDSTGIYAKDFQFQFRDQSISLNSVNNEIDAPLKLEFKNFDINTITDIAKKDSLFADGIVNGNAIVFDAVSSHPTFTSDIKITNLAYQRNTVGDLLVKVDNIGEDRFNANVELKGKKNQAYLRGTYQTKQGLMNLHLLADSLDMAILKPFSANQLKDASGNVKAKVDIEGSIDKPSVNGVMNFENVSMTSTMLGQKFKIDQDEVRVDATGIHFKEFSLSDSLGNKAILDGNLLTKNFRDYDFDLKLNAHDFNLINSTQADNQLFFGKLNMDADIKITGNLEAPNVNAKLIANKNTDLTVVMPGSNPEIQSREGVVNFIDTKKINDTLTKIIINDSLVKHSVFSALILNTMIETDTAAVFSMIIDSQTGDAITVKGKSNLAVTLDESGKLSLTGLYELEKGTYQFSLNMLKKKFEIVKGSTITWTGDPMSAFVNIAALYKLKASPIDLVEPLLVGQTQTEINKYKQRLPVEVYLKMNGDLMKPQIGFDIMIADQEISKWPLVDEKLQKLRTDESEMNKQVFALLLLGRFVGEDLMQNNTGSTTTGTMVRQSVSGVLSSQLNRVAGGLVKGVDINFDFESQDDYSTGTAKTRTDLKVGMSRTLNNDRIKVNVGANVPIEGTSSAQNASIISSDVQVDYMLSKDGKYMLRTYSKNKYEGVIEGQIIETGVTFIFTVEYDKFKEMFNKPGASDKEKKKKLAKENKVN